MTECVQILNALVNAFDKACKSFFAPARRFGRAALVKADLHLDGGLEMDFDKACKSRFAPTRGFGD